MKKAKKVLLAMLSVLTLTCTFGMAGCVLLDIFDSDSSQSKHSKNSGGGESSNTEEVDTNEEGTDVYSKGLEYMLSEDTYTVSGIGTCKDKEIIIPETYKNLPVTSINNFAFSDCDSLASIRIPNGVTSIERGAFYACKSLTNITIPDSVTSIGYYAFNNTGYYNDENNWENGALYLDGWLLNTNAIVVKEEYTIKANTKGIGGGAFEDCDSLTNITIPDGVTSIGEHAFYRCESLTSITIPDSVTRIEEYAFKDCDSLTNVKLPVFAISYMPITNLQTIVITSGAYIEDYAFSGCDNLTSITIPDSVTSIGDYVFRGCSSLTSITIPDSVMSIGDYVFCYCGGLTSITIPDSVTSIGDYAFRGCSSLISITMPSGVTSIGNSTFEGCSSLTSVYYKGRANAWLDISIGSFNGHLTHATRYYYSEKQPTEAGNYWYYDESGEIAVWE